MKASRLISELAAMIQEHGDLDVLLGCHGGTANDPDSVWLLYQDPDDPMNVYDHLCDAEDDCENPKPFFLIDV